MVAILILTVFVRILTNRDTSEVTIHTSNTEFSRWELPEGAKARLGKGKINDIKFSPNGRILASGGDNRSINLWDVTTGKQLTENPNVETPNVLKYTPDGKKLISGTYSGKIQLFDAHSCRLYSTHIGHTSWVNALAFTDDGKTLISASMDGTMLLWDWEKISHVRN